MAVACNIHARNAQGPAAEGAPAPFFWQSDHLKADRACVIENFLKKVKKQLTAPVNKCEHGIRSINFCEKMLAGSKKQSTSLGRQWLYQWKDARAFAAWISCSGLISIQEQGLEDGCVVNRAPTGTKSSWISKVGLKGDHRILNRQNAPDLSDEIEQLIMEMTALSFSKQNQLWKTLRTTYHPSVL